MIIRSLIIGGLIPCAMAQTCLTVTGDQILARDLMRGVPAFAAIPPNTPLAPSPLPGGTRVFYLSELQSVAARFSIAVKSPLDVCFRFATEALNRDRLMEAMMTALRIPEARIELLEAGPVAAPVGAIEFSRDNLGTPAATDRQTPVTWRGDIVYAGKRRFAIWAKVRIAAPVGRLVANEALRAGATIKPGQVRSEVIEGFPVATDAPPADQIAGMIAIRSVAPGAEVRIDNLTRPNDVNRGDYVFVEARVGAARLALTGRAETSGHIGDTVSIRNPDSSRVFRALVEGVGKVVVESAGNERAAKERN